MESGYISLHRKLQENPVFQDSETLHIFIYLLLNAAYKDTSVWYRGKYIQIKRGQLITGRHKISMLTKIHPMSIYRKLCEQQKLGILNIESNNEYSLITIVKYDDYQRTKEKVNNETNPNRTAKRTQSNNINKLNKINNNSLQPAVADEINQIFEVFFKTVNPAIQYQNKTHRNSAQELIKKVGFEKAINAAKFSVSIQDQKYAPTITNPYQLLNKYGELQAYYAKNNNKITTLKL